MTERGFAMWTVYDNPTDYPGKVVVRRFYALPGKLVREPQPWFVGETLDDARASLPPHLYQQPRQPDDDANIVEVWF